MKTANEWVRIFNGISVAVKGFDEQLLNLIEEIQHDAQDVLQEKARVLCETTDPPSGGYDWLDELGGLFRVMRMQRDSEMKTLETYRAKLDQAQRERDELAAKCEEMRKVLEFYANEKTYQGHQAGYYWVDGAIENDKGQIARESLKPEK